MESPASRNWRYSRIHLSTWLKTTPLATFVVPLKPISSTRKGVRSKLKSPKHLKNLLLGELGWEAAGRSGAGTGVYEENSKINICLVILATSTSDRVGKRNAAFGWESPVSCSLLSDSVSREVGPSLTKRATRHCERYLRSCMSVIIMKDWTGKEHIHA